MIRKRKLTTNNEVDTNDENDYLVSIKTAFTKIIKDEYKTKLTNIIEYNVHRLSRIGWEVSLLLNLHILRMCEKQLPIPQINQLLIVQIANLVSKKTKPDNDSLLELNDNNELLEVKETYELYYVPDRNICRDKLPISSRDRLGQFINCFAKQYMTCVQNQILLNFEKRTSRYMLIRMTHEFGRDVCKKVNKKTNVLGKKWIKIPFQKIKKSIYRFVVSGHIAKWEPKSYHFDPILLSRFHIFMLNLRTEMQLSSTSGKHLEYQIKQNPSSFLHWMYRIMKEFSNIQEDANVTKQPIPKGVRLFNLLPMFPLKPRCIQLTPTTLTTDIFPLILPKPIKVSRKSKDLSEKLKRQNRTKKSKELTKFFLKTKMEDTSKQKNKIKKIK